MTTGLILPGILPLAGFRSANQISYCCTFSMIKKFMD